MCLALNVYFEARNQDPDGQRLVAEVVMERARNVDFPEGVCAVVYQPGAFSWTEDGKSDQPREAEAWRLAQLIANDVLLNGCQFCTGATYYHEVSITPYWAKDFEVVARAGDHIFYRKMGCDE